MNSNAIETRMREEIKSRMESRSWDLEMASLILEKKRRKNRFFVFSASAASLAGFSIIIFLILFGTREETVRPGYSSFVSTQVTETYKNVFQTKTAGIEKSAAREGIVAQQVRGTYKSVFTSSGYSGDESSITGVALASDTDSLIDSALAERF